MEESKSKIVLIHQMKESMTNLQDSIDYFTPDYVFILSCQHYAKHKPELAVQEIKHKNRRLFSDAILKIEYVELVELDHAWDREAIDETFDKLSLIKKTSLELAKKNKTDCIFNVGFADAPPLVTVGVAWAAVLLDMKTYFTRGQRKYYNYDYVLEIENMNKITKAQNWLGESKNNKNNLKYLEAIINLEENGNIVRTNDLKEKLAVLRSKKACTLAIRKLESYELVKVSKQNPLEFNSTSIGKLISKMNPAK